jgi:hypothetical protein
MNSGAGVGDDQGLLLNHERVLSDLQLHAGLGFGFTLSAIKPVAGGGTAGHELVHVVGADGVNLEYNPARFPTDKKGRFVELQGPGISVGRVAGGPPVDLRIVGVGLTGEVGSLEGKTRLSYTLEAKLTLRSMVQILGLFGKKILRAVARAVARHPIVAIAVEGGASVLRFLTPAVAVGFAVADSVKAVKVCRDPTADALDKTLAVANAAADVVFIFNPVVGVVGNVAVAAVRVARGLQRTKEQPAVAAA